MRRSIRKNDYPEERASIPPQNDRKTVSVSELQDEDTEEVSDVEFKRIMLKFLRNQAKQWEEYGEFRLDYIKEMAQVQHSISQLEKRMASLTSGMNAAEARISDVEGNQIENTEQRKHLGKNLIKTKKSRQKIKDTTTNSSIRIIGIPEGVERESGFQEVFNEIVKENFPNSEKMKAIQIQEGKRLDPKDQIHCNQAPHKRRQGKRDNFQETQRTPEKQ